MIKPAIIYVEIGIIVLANRLISLLFIFKYNNFKHDYNTSDYTNSCVQISHGKKERRNIYFIPDIRT